MLNYMHSYPFLDSHSHVIDNHKSGYLGIARCFNVQGNKWSKRTDFQTTLAGSDVCTMHWYSVHYLFHYFLMI